MTADSVAEVRLDVISSLNKVEHGGNGTAGKRMPSKVSSCTYPTGPHSLPLGLRVRALNGWKKAGPFRQHLLVRRIWSEAYMKKQSRDGLMVPMTLPGILRPTGHCTWSDEYRRLQLQCHIIRHRGALMPFLISSRDTCQELGFGVREYGTQLLDVFYQMARRRITV